MQELGALKELAKLDMDIKNLPVHEISSFLDLALSVNEEDYLQAVDFVSGRDKLKSKTEIDRFKYLCGYLQRARRIYNYQNGVGV